MSSSDLAHVTSSQLQFSMRSGRTEAQQHWHEASAGRKGALGDCCWVEQDPCTVQHCKLTTSPLEGATIARATCGPNAAFEVCVYMHEQPLHAVSCTWTQASAVESSVCCRLASAENHGLRPARGCFGCDARGATAAAVRRCATYGTTPVRLANDASGQICARQRSATSCSVTSGRCAVHDTVFGALPA